MSDVRFMIEQMEFILTCENRMKCVEVEKMEILTERLDKHDEDA